MYREIGLDCISKYLKNKSNIELIEKYIFETTHNKDEYMHILYHVLIYLKKSCKTNDIKEIMKQLYFNNIEWHHSTFINYKKQIQEEDNFMTTPFEIEEGVLECKCGSKRTISFQRQTRSADEGSTTFAQCIECGNKWRHNN